MCAGHAPDASSMCSFRLDHLVALGVNAVQLMPVQEFATLRSLGYNGLD